MVQQSVITARSRLPNRSSPQPSWRGTTGNPFREQRQPAEFDTTSYFTSTRDPPNPQLAAFGSPMRLTEKSSGGSRRWDLPSVTSADAWHVVLRRFHRGLALATCLLAAGSSATQQGASFVTTTAARGANLPSVTALVSHSALPDDLLGGFRCAAILVAPDRVLTAGHCVARLTAAHLDVVVGADNLCSTAPIKGERIRVARIRRSKVADIADLILQHPTHVEPVRFAHPDSDGAQLLAVGWGNQRAAKDPCRRVTANLATTTKSACDAALARLEQTERPWQICALPTTGRNTCQGDSGGPLFDVAGSEPRLIAITSRGIGGCGADDVGLYVRIDLDSS